MTEDERIERLKSAYATYRATGARDTRWSESNTGNCAVSAERAFWMHRFLQEAGLFPLETCRVLEIGCARGGILKQLIEWGADPGLLVGVDVRPDTITVAEQRLPGVHFRVANAEHLDFPDNAFDLVLLFTVLSSAPDSQMSVNISREAWRVLKPNGAILLYDFRVDNPANPAVHRVTRAMIRGYFPGSELRCRSLTVLPPLSRRLGKLTRVLYPALTRVPLLHTHLLCLLRKPTSRLA